MSTVHRPGAQVVQMGEAREALALCAEMFDHFSRLLVPQVGKARQASNQLCHIPVLEATVEDEQLGEVWAAAGLGVWAGVWCQGKVGSLILNSIMLAFYNQGSMLKHVLIYKHKGLH